MAVEVIYFDESEANLVKEAKSFSDMQYDDEAANGAYGKLEEIQKKVGEITQVVESLEQGYNTLKEKYDTFTGFNDSIDRNTRLFKSVILNIEDKYQKLDKAIHEEVDEQVKLDTEHNEEIEELTQALNNEEAEGEGGDTPAGGSGEPTPTEGDTPAKDPEKNKPETTDPAAGGDTPTGKSAADIADEVIQGKWGTGDERKAALEAAGYDPTEVQKIVNQKVNGTYTGETPSSGGSSTPATETPTSGGGGGGGSTPTAGGDTPTKDPTKNTPTPANEEPAPTTPTSPTFQGGGVNTAMVETARSYLNTPYSYGGNSRNGIDCSALVQNVAREHGIELPRTTGELAKVGTQVSADQIQPGDVLFTNGGKHVVIVSGVSDTGEITVISANSVAGKVTEGTLTSNYVQARRYW